MSGLVEQEFSQAVVCTSCQGDARRSLECKMCGGAGVGVPSPFGFLVWSAQVNDFSITLRKVRRTIRAIVHVCCMGLVVLGLVAFGMYVFQLEDISALTVPAVWASGQGALVLFWFGLLVGCFLIFRLREFSSETKDMPHWGKTRRQIEAMEQAHVQRAQYRFEIQPYFSSTALDVVEGAFQIAQSLERLEVSPAMVFASGLASGTGAAFLVRLGTKFEHVKEPMARVLHAEPAGTPPILFSKETKHLLGTAFIDAYQRQRRQVTPVELLLVAFDHSPHIQEFFDQLGFPPEHVRRVVEWIRLEETLREDHSRFLALAHLKPATTMNRAMTARQTPFLDRFSEDLTVSARYGYLAPIIGRTREMEEILRAIESGRKAVMLVGEHGAGKMALVEQLARLMVEEDVPKELFDRRLVSVDIASVVAAGDPSLAAERLSAILHEVALSGNIVLVMRGAEALSGSGGSGPLDLSEIVSSELERRRTIILLTATPQAWTQYIERRSLGSKVVKVTVAELQTDDTLQVLMAKCGYIEYEQKVFFSYAALDKAATLSSRYIHDMAAPEHALSVIREAAVLARKRGGERGIVSVEDVARVVTDKTHIPVEALSQTESQKLLVLEDHLHARVIGQAQAVTAVSQALRRARTDMREGKRPIANFLFLGPTGVGKTELSKALAAEYFGNESAMIRLDMSEYQDASSVARVIGQPGDERGGLLTEAVRRQPFSLLLLDELEKAHPDILNLFLQVMDDGRLTDGVGRTIDFTNVMLIATSNAGTSFIQEEVVKQTPIEQIKTGLLERELKGVFRPEFLNRFDGVIVFAPLTMDEVTQIAWLMIRHIAHTLEQKGIAFTAEDGAVEELARAGYDPLFGARPLRRVIQDRVDNALADLLLRGELARKDQVILKADGQLEVRKAQSL